MSSEEPRKVSGQDIQLVQNFIEQCLRLYMTQKEVLNILFVQEKIEPAFTELVWQKLEQQNQEFFKAYHLRLMLKEQIMEFNRLLGRQVALMHHVETAGVSFQPINGSQIPLTLRNLACYAPENMGPALKTENMQQPLTPNIPNEFTNCGLLMPSSMQTTVDMSAHSRQIDISPDMLLAQSSNVGMSQGVNGGMIKTETGYPGMSQFIYGADGNVMETHPASISSFSSVESNSKPLNETMINADTTSYGLLVQISPNFGLSDLTPEFSHNSDILEDYSRSPFLGTDSDNFFNSHGRDENQGENRRLDTISEGLSYEDFGSD